MPAAGETQVLAEFLAELTYDDIPQDVLEAAKVLILDLIGCSLGAAEMTEGRVAKDVAKTMLGAPEALVLGLGIRSSAAHAAYLNGLTSHVIELDDTHRESITHVGAAVIPAALAVAERDGASGKQLLAAVVAGYEACLRVANAVQPSLWRRGYLSMGACGSFGAAASAAHLRGLDVEKMRWALGLAGTQTGGLNASIYGEGDMGKRLVPAAAAQNGVISAIFAEKGLTGPANILEQDKGFCKSFSDVYNLDRITDDLGTVWETAKTSIKPYSCCRYNHAAIDGLLSIMQDESIDADDIETITVRTYDIAVTNRPHRTNPKTPFDAKMSIPYTLAIVAHLGNADEASFNDETIARTDFQAFAGRVKVEADPEMSAVFPREWPAETIVLLKDGRTLTRYVPFPKGEPEAPMSREELERKFKSLAAVVLSEAAQDKVIDVIWNLDKHDSLDPLIEALTVAELK